MSAGNGHGEVALEVELLPTPLKPGDRVVVQMPNVPKDIAYDVGTVVDVHDDGTITFWPERWGAHPQVGPGKPGEQVPGAYVRRVVE